MARIPTFRQTICNVLMGYIYNPPNTYLLTQFQGIAEQNRGLQQAETLTFAYRGETYFVDPKQYVKPLVLHKALQEDMDRLLRDKERMDTEAIYVRSYLNKILSACKTAGECFAYLPDSLHRVLRDNSIEPVNLCGDHVGTVLAEIVQFNTKGAEYLKKRLLQNMILPT